MQGQVANEKSAGEGGEGLRDSSVQTGSPLRKEKKKAKKV